MCLPTALLVAVMNDLVVQGFLLDVHASGKVKPPSASFDLYARQRNGNDTWKSNSCPWPSIENLSRVFVDQIRATSPRMPPEVQLSADQVLLNYEWNAYEKLDGTNVGYSCNGKVLGRRFEIPMQDPSFDGTYQGMSLRENDRLPTREQIQKVKSEIIKDMSSQQQQQDDIDVIVYGELMINSDRYDYAARGLDEPWYAFGVVIDRIAPKDHDSLSSDLLKAGYCVHRSRSPNRIVLGLNNQLEGVLQDAGFSTTPKVTHGSLSSIIQTQTPLLCRDEQKSPSEGFVLTSSGLPPPPDNRAEHLNILKWKVGAEDISKGPAMLDKLIKDANRIELSESSLRLARDLVRVASHARFQTRGNRKKAQKTQESVDGLTKQNVVDAFASACTKYDRLSASFEQNQRSEILDRLQKEVQEDLQPKTADQQKYVDKTVGKLVGQAYGEWIREQNNNKM